MQEIVILSGKGGTGKTSIASALSMIAGTEVVVADCDVDAANMHILLDPDFAIKETFHSGLVASINQNSCIKCGECARVCRFEAVKIKKNQYLINKTFCEGCSYCSKVCPSNSISMLSRKSGNLYISEIKSGAKMVHAKLEAGGENSGKLVAQVKIEAKKIALAENKNYVLVDGPPGIGCPVISSLSGASIVVLVTEPSLSALNDLSRINQSIKNFNIPAVCIINKFDLDNEFSKETISFLKKNEIKVIAKIPFNDSFTKAMTLNKTIVEYDSEIKSLIIKLWTDITNLLNT